MTKEANTFGKKIGDLIEGPLGPVVRDINLTLSVRTIYSKLPPPYPTTSSHVVILRNKQLIIRANNSAAATKLRFVRESLINTLMEHGIIVEDVKILPQPNSGPVRSSS